MVPLSAKHRRQHGLPSDPSCGKQPQAKNPDRQKPSFHTHKTDKKAVSNAKGWFLGREASSLEKTT